MTQVATSYVKCSKSCDGAIFQVFPKLAKSEKVSTSQLLLNLTYEVVSCSLLNFIFRSIDSYFHFLNWINRSGDRMSGRLPFCTFFATVTVLK